MVSGPRMTTPMQLVLFELLVDPSHERYGLEIGRAAGLASGTVHPILARLEAIGWVESRWEEVDPRAASRPARRYYRLTRSGLQAAPPALERASRATRRSWAAPVPRQA